MIFNIPARPSAQIGVVEEFAKCPMNPLRGSCVSKRSRCGAVRICCLRTGLWKLSRGLRGCSRSRTVAGSIPAWSAATFLNVVRGRSSGWKIATFNYKCSTRSRVCEVLPESSGSTCAEQLAQSAYAEQPAQSNFHRALAQSSKHRATWAEQKSGCSVGRDIIMRVIARSVCGPRKPWPISWGGKLPSISGRGARARPSRSLTPAKSAFSSRQNRKIWWGLKFSSWWIRARGFLNFESVLRCAPGATRSTALAAAVLLG